LGGKKKAALDEKKTNGYGLGDHRYRPGQSKILALMEPFKKDHDSAGKMGGEKKTREFRLGSDLLRLPGHEGTEKRHHLGLGTEKMWSIPIRENSKHERCEKEREGIFEGRRSK